MVYGDNPEFMKMLCRLVEKKSIKCAIAVGKTTLKQRVKLVHLLNTSPDTRVFFINNSFTTGLNLHRANRLFFCSPSFDVTIEDQCIGRLDRIGQKRICYIYKCITKNSIDEAFLKIQANKRQELSSDGGSGRKKIAKEISNKELETIFSFNRRIRE